ncbi:MAG TPA: M28 family peptidase, partial [Ferruginibacter sp.]|nr:M28 family peptidase [Ferruginibacter sp.]
MKKLLVTFATGFISLFSFAQKIDKIINPTEVERIERILSADDMQGRKTFTPGIDKAADFIAAEFAKSKLSYFGNLKSYFQEFAMTKSKPVEVSGSIDNEPLTTDNIAANTTAKEISINSLKDYEVVIIKSTDTFNRKVFPLFELEKNLLVLVDTAHRNRFKSIQRFAGNAKFPSGVSQVFVLTGNLNPTAFNLHIKNEQTAQYLKNVIGVIPGKSRKDELVVFSGHYDHLGIGKPDKNQDSIFNGANDDAGLASHGTSDEHGDSGGAHDPHATSEHAPAPYGAPDGFGGWDYSGITAEPTAAAGAHVGDRSLARDLSTFGLHATSEAQTAIVEGALHANHVTGLAATATKGVLGA